MNESHKPVKILIVGAGDRGTEYAQLAKKNGGTTVVGVADPRDFYRNQIAEMHDVPADNLFTDWRQMIERDKFADAVVISTLDRDHIEPALAFAAKGYHMLLEKPMSPNPDECRQIVAAAVENKIIFAVCHVLRYTDYTQKLKGMIDSGLIGDVVCMQHFEPVGYWHQAHSFVRGNWGNDNDASFMLLAKSCHDIDWMRYIMGHRCLRVASFGSLHHFRKDQKPEGAGSRCVDCAVEPDCPYSAIKIYLGRVRAGETGWPVDVLAEEINEQTVTDAIRTGQYGQCVYECDNNVVDNQVVSLEYEGGRTANFIMTAFNKQVGRRTRIFGTRGELRGDGSVIEHFDFLTDKTEVIDTNASDASIAGGHGGGDGQLVERFIKAVATNDPSPILSGPAETLESHMTVFAAERSRIEGRIVDVEL